MYQQPQTQTHSLLRPVPVTDDLRSASCVMHPNSTLHLALEGKGLTNVATGYLFSRASSPVFKVCAYTQSLDKWEPLVTSERMVQDLNPSWPMISIRCDTLCQCDLGRPIQIQVFDQDSQGNDVAPMGHFETTARELLGRQTGGVNQNAFQFTLVQEGKPVGNIVVVLAMIEIEQPQQRHQAHNDNLLRKLEEPTKTNSVNARNSLLDMVGEAWFKRPMLATDESEEGGKEEEEEGSGEPHIHDKKEEKDQKLKQTTNDDEQETGQTTSKETIKKGTNQQSVATVQEDTAQEHNQSSPEKESNATTTQEEKKEEEQDATLRLVLRGMDLKEMPAGIGQEVATNRSCRISKFQPGQHAGALFQEIFSSSVVPHNQNPLWEEWKLSINEICGGNWDLPILLTVWEDGDGAAVTQMGSCETQMGSCQTTVTELLKKQPMTLTQRGRTMGKLAVVEASILEEGDGEAHDQVDEEPAVAVPNWLARTLNLAAGLRNYAGSGIGSADNGANETPSSEEESDNETPLSDRDGGDNINDKEQNDMDASIQNITKILEAVESHDGSEEEDDDDDDDDGNGNDDDLSVGSSGSDDEITIADVLSIAGQSFHRGRKEDQEGLLALTVLLTPRVSPTKPARTRADSILAGIARFDLDDDSVPMAHNAAEVLECEAEYAVCEEERITERASEFEVAAREPQDTFDVDWDMALATSMEEKDQADKVSHDLDGDDRLDGAVLKGAAEDDKRGAKNKLTSKKSRKKAKKRVQKTLKSIHKLLTENLRSIPETHTPEEEVMKTLDRPDDDMEKFGIDSFNTETFDMEAFDEETVDLEAADEAPRASHTKRRSPKRSQSLDDVPHIPSGATKRRSRRHPARSRSTESGFPLGSGGKRSDSLGGGKASVKKSSRSPARTASKEIRSTAGRRPSRSPMRSRSTESGNEARRSGKTSRSHCKESSATEKDRQPSRTPLRSKSHENNLLDVKPKRGKPQKSKSHQDGRVACEKNLGLSLTAQFAEDALLGREIENNDDQYVPPEIVPEHSLDAEVPLEAQGLQDSFPPPKAKTGKHKRRGSVTSGLSMMRDGVKSAVKGSVNGVVKGSSVVVKAGRGVMSSDKEDSKKSGKAENYPEGMTNESGSPKSEVACLHESFPAPNEKPKRDGSPKCDGGKRLPRRRNSMSGGLSLMKDGVKVVVNAGRGVMTSDKGSPKKDAGSKHAEGVTNETGNPISEDGGLYENPPSSKGTPKESGGSKHGSRKNLPARRHSMSGLGRMKDGVKAVVTNDAAKAIGGNVKGAVKGSAKGVRGVASAGAMVMKAGAKAGVKAGTTVTKGGASMGKKVVTSSFKASVKVGKGTFSAGVHAGKYVKDHLPSSSRGEPDDDDGVPSGYAQL